MDRIDRYQLVANAAANRLSRTINQNERTFAVRGRMPMTESEALRREAIRRELTKNPWF